MPDDGKQLTLEELHARNRPPETTPVAVRLPEPLLEELDELWQDRDFENRSEFVRTVVRYVVDNGEEFEDLTPGYEEEADQPFPPKQP